MENRYTSRFRAIGERTGDQIKNRDSAGNLTEHLTHARGSIEAQQKNAQELFSTAKEMITGINTQQNMMGVELVRNIPLPSTVIENSHANKLGYVQLTMRFLQAGVLHFMEEMANAQQRIGELESTVATLAKYDYNIDVIGQMATLDLDSPELMGTVPVPSVTRVEEPPQPEPKRADSALSATPVKPKPSTAVSSGSKKK